MYFIPKTRIPSNIFTGPYLALRVEWQGHRPQHILLSILGAAQRWKERPNPVRFTQQQPDFVWFIASSACSICPQHELCFSSCISPDPNVLDHSYGNRVIIPSLCTFALTQTFFTRSSQNQWVPLYVFHRNSPVLITPETVYTYVSYVVQNSFSYRVHSLNTQIRQIKIWEQKRKVKPLAQDQWWYKTSSLTPPTLTSHRPLLDRTILHCFNCSRQF